jgi:hypothetical protein
MSVILQLPQRGRGRQSASAIERYEAKRVEFCDLITEIASTLDFRVGSRGWCYLLEEHGLSKGDFDRAQTIINDCRKDGLLPLDICAEDGARSAENLEQLDETDPEEQAQAIVDYLGYAHESYTPISFWEDQDVYVEMFVEKIDLRSLFGPVCAEFNIPIRNMKGWGDINGRADTLRRFAHWSRLGKKCVLLYCGDHDPAGLNISEFLRSNLRDISRAVGFWFEQEDDLIIDRFGLNYDFIHAEGLTWIDNLHTSSGDDLADPRHRDHHKDYVQSYIKRYGVRKCEANALVVAPEAGRDLCRDAILRYLAADAPAKYQTKLDAERQRVKAELRQILAIKNFEEE